MGWSRQNPKIVDCSPLREEVDRWVVNDDGTRTKPRRQFVSFYAVFPGRRPGEIEYIYLDLIRFPIDGRTVRRETFESRWLPDCEGLLFEDLELTQFGGRIPKVCGYARDRSTILGAAN